MRSKIKLLQYLSKQPVRTVRKCCVIILIFALVFTQFVGCAAVKIPPYTPPSLDTMSITQRQQDLLIAVAPVTDKNKQIEYFGKDLKI
jgi:hypothetical protein